MCRGGDLMGCRGGGSVWGRRFDELLGRGKCVWEAV